MVVAVVAALGFVTPALAQWPTTCVELNDIVEAHLGNDGNVGIYQRVFGDQAEQACQNDHRDDVRGVFGWAFTHAASSAESAPQDLAWPTDCVELNDIVENHLGNRDNVGIYQRVFGAQAETACRNDHRQDVRGVFAWAFDNPAAADSSPPTPTPTPTPTATPTPEPASVVLETCRDGMRLRAGEGCRYTGGGSPPANVVLSVQHDGAICREGGPVQQTRFGLTVTVENLRLCYPDGFEVDDAFQSDIVAIANADGSWTFYESRSSASRARATLAPTSNVSLTEWNDADIDGKIAMLNQGRVPTCREGLEMPIDSLCFGAGTTFTKDDGLKTRLIMAVLPDGRGLVRQPGISQEAGTGIFSDDIAFENRETHWVISRLNVG